MLTHDTIRREVEAMLRQRWPQVDGHQAGATRHAGRPATPPQPSRATPPVHDPPPVCWVLDELLGLLAEYHDRPVDDLRPAIRSLISERAYFDHDGHALATTSRAHAITLDAQVDVAVTVLEKMRRQALREGQWTDHRPAPQMCG